MAGARTPRFCLSQPLLRALVDRDVVAPRRTDVELARTPDLLSWIFDHLFHWLGVAAAHPTAEWIARQLTEACGWECTPRYIVRDRDRVYCEFFARRLRAMAQSGSGSISDSRYE
jgi:hypothetical protein